MKKVTGVLILKRHTKYSSRDIADWQINLYEKERILEECLQQWHKTDEAEEIELQIEIKSIFQFKSSSQLGYLHAAVLPPIYRFMEDAGDDCSDEHKKIKLKFHPEINYVDYEKDVMTGDSVAIPKSFAKASKEAISDIIGRLIRLAGDFGIEIETPENYKLRRNIKFFIK